MMEAVECPPEKVIRNRDGFLVCTETGEVIEETALGEPRLWTKSGEALYSPVGPGIVAPPRQTRRVGRERFYEEKIEKSLARTAALMRSVAARLAVPSHVVEDALAAVKRIKEKRKPVPVKALVALTLYYASKKNCHIILLDEICDELGTLPETVLWYRHLIVKYGFHGKAPFCPAYVEKLIWRIVNRLDLPTNVTIEAMRVSKKMRKGNLNRRAGLAVVAASMRLGLDAEQVARDVAVMLGVSANSLLAHARSLLRSLEDNCKHVDCDQG